jgi:uncharacterized membrane protein (DUF373 family)
MQSGKNVPVHVAHVIADGIVTVIREVCAAAAFSGQMLTSTAIGQSSLRMQPHPFNTT